MLLNNPSNNPLLTMAEICTLLGITRQSMLTYIKQGNIPYYRLGHKYSFDYQQVKQAIQSNNPNNQVNN